MTDKLANATYIAPIFASLLFGVLCTFLVINAQMETYPVTPFPEDAYGFLGSLGNGLYFIVLVGGGATFLYIFIKRKNQKMIKLLTGFAVTTAIFALSMFYLIALFSNVNMPYPDLTVIALALLMTAAGDYVLFRNVRNLSFIIVLALGGALGAFLGAMIPTASAVLILALLAVYDTFAVYRGPVGKIARSGLEQLRGLSFSFKDVQMGLGDLTFYSMLSGVMLINFGFYSCLASIAGILAGCLLSFKMLEKKGIFPGLPFPVLLGLLLGFIASLAH